MVLDSAAWWEILHETPRGRDLARNYLQTPGGQVITVDMALAEISCKLSRLGQAGNVQACLQTMADLSEVIPISQEAAEASGPLLVELRRRDPDASLADAVMLASARARAHRLVSNDPAYRGQPDVVWT